MTGKTSAQTGTSQDCRAVEKRLDSVPDWIFEISMDGVITYSNKAVRNLLGYTPKKLVGTPIFDIMNEEDSAKCRSVFSESTKVGEPAISIVTNLRAADSSIKRYKIVCALMRVSRGGPTRFVGIARNIADVVVRQQLALEIEADCIALVENLKTGIIIIQDQKIAYANPRICELMGYSCDEVIGTSIWNYVHPDEVAELTDAQQRRLVGEEIPMDRVTRAITKNGEVKYLDFRTNVIIHKNAPAILLNAFDITDRVRAQEALEKSEREFRDLVEKTSDWFWQIDENTIFTYSSPRSRDILGYEPEEIVGKLPYDFMSEEEAEKIRKIFEPKATNREPFSMMENTLIHRNGQPVVMEANGEPIFDEDGVFRGYRGSDRDITERKRTEELLRKATSEMEIVLHAFPDVYFWIDESGRIVSYHASDIKELYAAPEQFLNRKFDESIPDKAARKFKLAMNEARKTNSAVATEYLLKMHGKPKWYEARIIPIADQGFMIIVRNITKRKQSEAKMRESREMMQLVINNIPQFVFWKDKNSVFLGCNNNFARAAGLHNAADIIGKTDYDMPWADADARSYREWDLKVMESNEPSYHIIEAQQTAEGETKWLDTNKIPLHDSEGHVIGILGTYEDITERRQSQQALQEAEAKYRSLVEETMVGVYMIQDDQFVYLNSRMLDILGAELEDLLGKSPLEFTAPQDRATVAENIRQRIRGEAKAYRYAFKALRKDGTLVDVEVHSAVTNYKGRPAIIGSMVDNTERKNYVEALRDSEERYRQLFEHSPDMIFLISARTGVCVAMNPAVTQVLGYAPYDVLGKSPWDISPEFQPDGRNSKETIQRQLSDLVGSPSQRYEWVYKHKDGALLDCEVSLVGYRFHGEDLLQEIVRDVTDRKRVEENRRLLERELEQQKRLFYRETILSVTDGTLDICDWSDIEPYLNSARDIVQVNDASEVAKARKKVENLCKEQGIEGDRLHDYIVAVGEAITNAIKHGTNGTVYVGNDETTVWVAVSDKGSGIESLILPRAVLLRGFSTKPSLGMGYSIMIEVCDRILLCTGKHGTTVVLIKEKAVHPPESAEQYLPDTWSSIPG